METDSYTPLELKRAIRKLSILPLAESIVTIMRFAVSGNLISVFTLYKLGYIIHTEFVGGSSASP